MFPRSLLASWSWNNIPFRSQHIPQRALYRNFHERNTKHSPALQRSRMEQLSIKVHKRTTATRVWYECGWLLVRILIIDRMSLQERAPIFVLIVNAPPKERDSRERGDHHSWMGRKCQKIYLGVWKRSPFDALTVFQSSSPEFRREATNRPIWQWNPRSRGCRSMNFERIFRHCRNFWIWRHLPSAVPGASEQTGAKIAKFEDQQANFPNQNSHLVIRRGYDWLACRFQCREDQQGPRIEAMTL